MCHLVTGAGWCRGGDCGGGGGARERADRAEVRPALASAL